MIATSNAGAAEAAKGVGFGATSDVAGRRQRIRAELERQFRPEFLNRFQHVVIFHPLTEEQVRQVARQELKRVLSREGIVARNLVVDVDDDALALVVARGYDARYGARGLKREIQSQLVLPLAMVLMERDIEAGQLLRIGVRDGRVHIRVLDTTTSRATRREREPVKVDGRKLDRAAISTGLTALRARVDVLAEQVGEGELHNERSRLTTLREDPTFWRDSAVAARTLRDLDRIAVVLERVDRLRTRVDSMLTELAEVRTRPALEQLGHRLVDGESAVDVAVRELVRMGTHGGWDAIVEVSPVGLGGAPARDLLVDTYLSWARDRQMEVDWLRDPLDVDEPAMFAVRGRYAHGLLRGEAGLHRVRAGDEHGVARVRVAPWTDERTDALEIEEHRAFKRDGRWGRVRSRLVVGGLVLQNASTLAENRELAAALLASWRAAPVAPDEVIRRYDPAAPLVRDHATGTTTQRPDALAPVRFHELLCLRVDRSDAIVDEDV